MAKKKKSKKVKKAVAKKISKKTSKKTGKTAGKKAAKKATKKVVKKISRKSATQTQTRNKSKSKNAGMVNSVQTLLSVGQRAPDFQLPNESGKIVRLSDYRGKPIVLYFYPKDDTPGCTQESCDFKDNYSRVQSVGAEVFGVSRDDVRSHQKFKEKYSLPFSLLADTEGKVTESYGVWKEKSMYGRTYMGIERTTFLINAEGVIEKIYPKVSVTGHVDQVLEDLKGKSS